MINIAICDDDRMATESLEKMLYEIAAESNITIRCESFYGGTALTGVISEQRSYFELIYLDIEMDDMSGIHTALQLRDLALPVLIVYVSAHEEYLKELLLGTSPEKVREKNERAVPWQRAKVCNLLEAIAPYSPLCDETWHQWLFIAGRAYEDGEYSYEKDKAAQHEVFLTRENRLIPMQSELLLKRREKISMPLENAIAKAFGAPCL